MSSWTPCDVRIPAEPGWYRVHRREADFEMTAYNFGLDPTWYIEGTLAAPPGSVTRWRPMTDAERRARSAEIAAIYGLPVKEPAEPKPGG